MFNQNYILIRIAYVPYNRRDTLPFLWFLRRSRMVLERDYQSRLIKKLRRLFPDAIILKNDSSYQQGIPDLSIFHGDRWAMLEVKPKRPRPGTDDFEPNQEWFIDILDRMSFCACIYPLNEREVLRDLQRSLAS